MPLLDKDTLQDVVNALEAHGETELLERLKKAAEIDEAGIDDEEFLKSGEAASLLGVSSINTVKNWLEGGFFPGARKTAGGHWRFRRSEVEAVAVRMSLLSDRNETGELSPPDSDESSEPPLL